MTTRQYIKKRIYVFTLWHCVKCFILQGFALSYARPTCCYVFRPQPWFSLIALYLCSYVACNTGEKMYINYAVSLDSITGHKYGLYHNIKNISWVVANETAYSEEVRSLASWCHNNGLQMKGKQNQEAGGGFHQEASFVPINISGVRLQIPGCVLSTSKLRLKRLISVYTI